MREADLLLVGMFCRTGEIMHAKRAIISSFITTDDDEISAYFQLMSEAGTIHLMTLPNSTKEHAFLLARLIDTENLQGRDKYFNNFGSNNPIPYDPELLVDRLLQNFRPGIFLPIRQTSVLVLPGNPNFSSTFLDAIRLK